MTPALLPKPTPLPSSAVRPHVSKMANGATLIVEQIPVEAVALSIWLNVGSAVEADEINGMAHFLEHGIFKGTAKQPLGVFERAIESCGGKTNAGTSQDYTNYYITVSPQDFAKLAPRQIDLVLNAAIPDQEFERERLVVMEEIRRSEDNCDRRIYRQVLEMIHPNLPYRRPVLGNIEVIGNLKVDQMRDFHQTWYRPENMTVVAVGGSAIAEMTETICQAFAEFEPSTLSAPLAISWQPELAFKGIQRQEISDPSLQRARLIMNWRIPGLQELDRVLPLSVLASILGGGRTSRLVKDLKETQGICDRLSVNNSTQYWQGNFQISLQLPAANVAIAEQAICEHIRQVREHLVEDWELEKICTQTAKRFIFANESPKERADLYGYYDRLANNLEMALDYPQRLAKITATEVRAAAIEFLDPNAYGVLTALPR